MGTSREELSAALTSTGATQNELRTIAVRALQRAKRKDKALEDNPDPCRVALALGIKLRRPTAGRERVWLDEDGMICVLWNSDPREAELNVLLGIAVGLFLELGIAPTMAEIFALAGYLAIPDGKHESIPYLPERFVTEHLRRREGPRLRLVSA